MDALSTSEPNTISFGMVTSGTNGAQPRATWAAWDAEEITFPTWDYDDSTELSVGHQVHTATGTFTDTATLSGDAYYPTGVHALYAFDPPAGSGGGAAGSMSWTFDFGDGSVPVFSLVDTVTHTFTVPGTYPVTALVADADGLTDVDAAILVVGPSASTQAAQGGVAGLVARRSMSFAQGLARRSAVGAMNSLVRITRAGGWDTGSFEYDPAQTQVVYDDADYPGTGAIAGVTPASGSVTMDIGDEPQYFSSLTVYIPQAAPINPRIGDLVQVMANPDADIIGSYYRVTDVPVGGRLTSSITLRCTGIAPSKEIVGGI